MKIVRTLVEDHKEPENKSVYWLDLNTKIVKRWADEAWVPLFEVDFHDMQNVNIVGDQIPVRDVNVVNDHIDVNVLNDININGKVEIDDTKPVNVNISNDTPIQVEVTNQMEIDTPLDVNIVSPDPLNVQFENSEDTPLYVTGEIESKIDKIISTIERTFYYVVDYASTSSIRGTIALHVKESDTLTSITKRIFNAVVLSELHNWTGFTVPVITIHVTEFDKEDNAQTCKITVIRDAVQGENPVLKYRKIEIWTTSITDR